MKDRAQDVAAGRRLPERDSCGPCHKTMDDGTFARVHAHKGK